ncbi:MAG TPA: MarR family transcriptional regulator [Magnetospirillaceae bacterium]|jgi:DNA-binding MarR family transcriptional regulator
MAKPVKKAVPKVRKAVAVPAGDDLAALDLSALDDLAGYFVRMVQLRMFQLFHDRFADARMSPGVYCALVVIGANPGVRAGVLGDALMIRRSNMTKLLDALERRSLVKRTPSDTDRRSVELSLTDAGHKLVAAIKPDIMAHESFALSVLSVHERHLFFGLLGKLNEGIRTLKV